MTLFALVLVIVGMAAAVWRILRPTGRNSIPTTLKFAPLAVGAFGLQLVALNWGTGIGRTGLFAVSQLALLTLFAINYNCKPVRLLAIGFLLNFLPMLFNGGYMPITQAAMAELHPRTQASQWQVGLVPPGSKDIVVSPTESPLWFMGDVFVVGKQISLPTAFSLGDLLILTGFGWTVYYFTPLIGVSHDAVYRSGTNVKRGSRGPAI